MQSSGDLTPEGAPTKQSSVQVVADTVSRLFSRDSTKAGTTVSASAKKLMKTVFVSKKTIEFLDKPWYVSVCPAIVSTNKLLFNVLNFLVLVLSLSI